MNRMLNHTAALLILGLCIFALTAQAMAKNESQTNNNNAANANQSMYSKSSDQNMKNKPVRTSELVGKTVWNKEGKEIGQIHDLVIDEQTGKIRYAALSYGGLWGMGDKLFAVPWKAFKCEPGKQGEKSRLILDIKEQKLKSLKGFNQENWPDFANRNITGEIDRQFNNQMKNNNHQESQFDVNVDTQRSPTKTNNNKTSY